MDGTDLMQRTQKEDETTNTTDVSTSVQHDMSNTLSISSRGMMSESSSFWSASNSTGLTSMSSVHDLAEGRQHEQETHREHFGDSARRAGVPTTSIDMLTGATTSRPYDPSQNLSSASNTLTSPPRLTIPSLPTNILRRIFATAATQSYQARLTLPLVCRAFKVIVGECSEMWDTFEVTTSNAYSLVSRRQVDYVVRKAGDRKLSVGLGISGGGIQGWDNEGEESAGGGGFSDGASEMVEVVGSLMDRVEELILDVQGDEIEAQIERAVLGLFEESRTETLKSLTLVGGFQLDRLLRLRTPSTHSHHSTLIPSLPSLRHLSIGFCSALALPGTLPQLTSLEVSIFEVEGSSGYSQLHSFLLCFPNLIVLGIHCQSGEVRPSGRLLDTSSFPSITLHRLGKLTLDSIPLTFPILSCLLTPNLQTLTLSDFSLGFDLRDVSFSTTLSEYPIHKEANAKGLQPLPFGVFLSANAQWGRLNELNIKTLPNVVARMCADFTRIVGSSVQQSSDCKGLTRLSLADFAWSDWESLLGRDSVTDGDPRSAFFHDGGHAAPLPQLQHLRVHLDQVSAWKTAGFMNGKNEERQAWMDGLMGLAERRMSKRAVKRMLESFNMPVPSWLTESVGKVDEKVHEQGRSSSVDAPGSREDARTINSIELDTVYTDSFAFLHAAWLVLEKENSGRGGVTPSA